MSVLHPFHAFPKHLFHASLPPAVVYNAVDEQEAREKGFTETYVHQDYPKDVTDSRGVTVTVHNPEEEAVHAVEPEAEPEAVKEPAKPRVTTK
jgi:hypothetical protein